MLNSWPARAINLFFDGRQLLGHVAAQLLQQREVEADAVEFQLGQHFDQRDFQIVVELAKRANPVRLAAGSARCWVSHPIAFGFAAGRTAARPRRRPRRNTRRRGSSAPGPCAVAVLAALLADQVRDRDHLMIQIATCKLFQVMAAFAGVQEIIGHHRIAGHAAPVRCRWPAAPADRT